MLWLLSGEVLFEEVDFVVLLDALGSTLHHLFSGLSKSVGSISVHFLSILSLVTGLSWVDFLGPSYKYKNKFYEHQRFPVSYRNID